MYAIGAGVVLGGVSLWIEHWFLGIVGLGLEASRSGAAAAGLAMFLFVAPLREGLEVLALWPLKRRHVLDGAALGMLYAACVGAGFGAAVGGHYVATHELSTLSVSRALGGGLAHLFFAGAWGYALGSGRGGRGRWFSLTWFAAMIGHATYAHIVLGRGPGLLVAAVPMVVAMILASWAVLRDVGLVASSRSLLLHTFEPPSIETVRRALTRKHRPLMPHWVALSVLVTLGLMISLVAIAVYLGHRIGIDFAAATESDWRSSGPLILLGVAVLAAFPGAGFLVARATAATSVLEPALGAGLAILVVIALLSLAEPVTVVFALGTAPVAFGLACGGAWFGLAR